MNNLIVFEMGIMKRSMGLYERVYKKDFIEFECLERLGGVFWRGGFRVECYRMKVWEVELRGDCMKVLK